MEEVTEGVDEAGSDDSPMEESASDAALSRLERIIESVLFASATPLSLRRLVDVLDGPTTKEVQAAVGRLMADYAAGQRGIRLHEVAGGYQFRTARENAEWVRAVFKEKPARMGRAGLETLAIVAYKQPVTRAEIEAIRGVDVEGVLSSLLSRRLIKIAGRKEAVGRPLLYSTTPEFLETFGLKDLKELPSLKELGPAPDAEDGENAAHSEVDESAAASADRPPDTAGGGAPAEDSQPGGDRLATQGRGADPGGPRAGERSGGDPAGDEGEPADRPDHD